MHVPKKNRSGVWGTPEGPSGYRVQSPSGSSWNLAFCGPKNVLQRLQIIKCFWKKNPINFLFRVQISPRSCIMDCFPQFLFFEYFRLQTSAKIIHGLERCFQFLYYWLHISGSRIMNMLAFSLLHCCLIDITHMLLPCALSHTLGSF